MPVAAWRVRADERMPVPVSIERSTGALRFRAAPREIVSFRVS